MSPQRHRDDEDDDLSELRFLAIRVFLVLSVLVVLVDILGRLFKDATFHVDPVAMGLVFGTLLSLLGLESIQQVINRKGSGE